MRTAILIVIGFAVWAACLGVAKLAAGGKPLAATAATSVFAVIWFCVAAWNMWNGVANAGYSVSEELPIFFLIFVLPVVVALVVTWRFL
jgi:hypothetical protein